MKLHALWIPAISACVLTLSASLFAQDAPAPAAEKAAAPAPAATPAAPEAAPAPAPEAAPAAPEAAPAPAPEAAAPAAAPAPGMVPPPNGQPQRRPFVMRGMLPMGYRDVVTGEQREQIYAIQKEYRPKMEELMKQMSALRQEMDQKIESILTPEQKEKIKARETEMKARRGLRREAR